MRKTSYAITFVLVAAVLTLNIFSSKRVDWLVIKFPEILRTKTTVTYGLATSCESSITRFPSPDDHSEIVRRSFKCRPFPSKVSDGCEKDSSGRAFCAEWTSAYYIDQLAIGFGAVSLAAILFGVTTHSRRRRIWRAVAGLVFMQGICQLVTFMLITHNYNTLPDFEQARPGAAYVLNILSWAFGFLVALGVIVTGISADQGHKWAAGNRAYRPIPSGA